MAPTKYSQQKSLASERDTVVYPVVRDERHGDDRRDEETPSGRCDRQYDPQSRADSQRHQPVEEDRRAGTARVTAAPVERALALVGGVAEGLRDVGRRIDFVDNDVHKARGLAAEADSRSLATETTVAGDARRLERFEQSNEGASARGRDLEGSVTAWSAKASAISGAALCPPQYIHLRQEKRRVIPLETPDIKCRV